MKQTHTNETSKLYRLALVKKKILYLDFQYLAVLHSTLP
jgi:hypothetical protein